MLRDMARYETDVDDEGLEDTRYHQYLDVLDSSLEAGVLSNRYPVTWGDMADMKYRSWRELAAISFAAYATHEPEELYMVRFPKGEAQLRLLALDMTSILKRLSLARYWLTDVRNKVVRSSQKQSAKRR